MKMEPIIFLQFENDGKLCLNPESIQVIEEDKNPIKVVSIIGPAGSGKSYLEKFFIGLRESMPPMLSQFKTPLKGIWMWRRKCENPDSSIVFLCSEGLFGSKDGSDDVDLILLTISILLSDIFIFSTVRNMEDIHLECLSQAALAARCLLNSVKGQQTKAILEFPLFVWTVRDASEPLLDGKLFSPEEFLEESLKIKPGVSHEVIITNNYRDIIRKCFTERECIFFPPTTTDPELTANLNTLTKKDILDDFSFLLKLVSDRSASKINFATGKSLTTSINSFVKLITTNTVLVRPICPHDTDEKNEKNLESAIQDLKDKIDHHRLPMSVETFNEVRKQLKAEILQVGNENMRKKLENVSVDLTAELYEANENASTIKCLRALKDSFAQVEDELKKGKYSSKGSFNALEAKLDQVKKDYFLKSENEEFGPQVSDVMHDFNINTVIT